MGGRKMGGTGRWEVERWVGRWEVRVDGRYR